MSRKVLLILMIGLYIIAGCNHFIHPEFYLKIMPSYIPFHFALVIVSGVIEIILGVLLVFKKTRSTAAWLIICMLIVFMTVHIQMMVDHQPTFIISIIRFIMQFGLIFWAYTYTVTHNRKTTREYTHV